MYKTYIQDSQKISYSSIEDLISKINELNISADFSYSISFDTIPDCTDTKMWLKVNFYKQI